MANAGIVIVTALPMTSVIVATTEARERERRRAQRRAVACCVYSCARRVAEVSGCGGRRRAGVGEVRVRSESSQIYQVSADNEMFGYELLFS
ncbi:hypothetical protein C5D35_00970 [Rathayibacter toxicus]|nr:hypothetical protein C5D35_00970 [Rathayibacter toxicus]